MEHTFLVLMIFLTLYLICLIVTISILFPMKGSLGKLEEFRNHTINKIKEIDKKLKDKNL